MPVSFCGRARRPSETTPTGRSMKRRASSMRSSASLPPSTSRASRSWRACTASHRVREWSTVAESCASTMGPAEQVRLTDGSQLASEGVLRRPATRLAAYPSRATRSAPTFAHARHLPARLLRPCGLPGARFATSLRLLADTSRSNGSGRPSPRATPVKAGLDACCTTRDARRQESTGLGVIQTVGGVRFSSISAVCPGRRVEGRTLPARSSRPAARNKPISAWVVPRKASS